MMPGVSQRNRDVEGVAELHESRGLVGAVAVDRAGEIDGVVRDQSDRTSFDSDQSGQHPESEMPAYLEHRAGIGESLNDRSDVVDAKSIFGNYSSQKTLVGACPVAQRTLKVRQVGSRHLYRFGFVRDRDVHDAISYLHIHWADFFGPEDT
jgi:hypothetical protein